MKRFVKKIKGFLLRPLSIMFILNLFILIGVLVIGQDKYAGAGCVALPTQVCVQVSDKGCTAQFGPVMCAPIGSWTGWAHDANSYNPDCFRIMVK